MARVVKLFVLGLPGSGKSALSRYISDYVNHPGDDTTTYLHWTAIHFNDYAILLDLFHQDTEGKRFKPAKPGGFDVIDLNVFNEALVILEQKVNTYIDSLNSEEQKLIIIEFSRNDYEKAFQLFNEAFPKHAYFLYLDTALDECKQRVNQRAAHPTNEKDDYPVSDYIFEGYYCRDNWIQIRGDLAKEYKTNKESIWTFNNNHSYKLALLEIKPYIEKMLKSNSQEKFDEQEHLLEEERMIREKKFAGIGF